MNLTKIFLFFGRFLIAFYFIAIFLVSLTEFLLQKSTILSPNLSISQIYIDKILNNINAKPLISLSLSSNSFENPLILAYYSNNSYEIPLFYWKNSSFFEESLNYWNFSSRNGSCENGFSFCDSGLCVLEGNNCPLSDIRLENGSLFVTNQTNSNAIIEIFVNYKENSSCFNGKLTINNQSKCQSFTDDYMYNSLDFEKNSDFSQENELNYDNEKNRTNSTIYLILERKIRVFSDGICANLNGMKNITIFTNFSDFDDYRLITTIISFSFSAFGMLIFLIYFLIFAKNQRNFLSFIVFWFSHGLGVFICIFVLIYDEFSFEFLNDFENSNEFLYNIGEAYCFNGGKFNEIFENSANYLKEYYEDREVLIDIGLVLSAGFIIFEGIFVMWWTCGYKCRSYIEEEEEIMLRNQENEEYS